jgi:predicted nuclease with RNAse H fold
LSSSNPNNPSTMQTGLLVGYDPGGDSAHGIALLSLDEGRATALSTRTLDTTEEVIAHFERLPAVSAIGVDTLTCWSTGGGGWRPADRWLRERYKTVRNSVMTPNRLAGSMGLNGMSVLLAIRGRFPGITIVETHPKVLYWALAHKKYDYASAKADMERMLSQALGATVITSSEHEWDAALSAFAAANGVLGRWTNDLHTLPCRERERLTTPCGKTNYYWPE